MYVSHSIQDTLTDETRSGAFVSECLSYMKA
jgi:hypothetical protein